MRNIICCTTVAVILFFCFNNGICAQNKGGKGKNKGSETVKHQIQFPDSSYYIPDSCTSGFTVFSLCCKEVNYVYAIAGYHNRNNYYDRCQYKPFYINWKNFLLSVQTNDIPDNRKTCFMDCIEHDRLSWDLHCYGKNKYSNIPSWPESPDSIKLLRTTIRRQIIANCRLSDNLVDKYASPDCYKNFPKLADYVGGVDFYDIIDYRIAALKNLQIYALDKTIFGTKAGKPLNDFFVIKIPRHEHMQRWTNFIFDSRTDSLLYGINNAADAPRTISGFLNLHPYALPAMLLEFRQKPPERLPIKVRFVVEMTLEDNRILRDTTQYVTITK